MLLTWNWMSNLKPMDYMDFTSKNVSPESSWCRPPSSGIALDSDDDYPDRSEETLFNYVYENEFHTP